MDMFSRVIILLSVVTVVKAQSFAFGMISSQQYVPEYISPLIQQCLLFDLEALISSSIEITPAQETVIRSFYTYCQNIMNIALLVSNVSTSGSGSSQSTSSSQYNKQSQAQAQFSKMQQSSGSQNLNAQLTTSGSNNNMGS